MSWKQIVLLALIDSGFGLLACWFHQDQEGVGAFIGIMGVLSIFVFAGVWQKLR